MKKEGKLYSSNVEEENQVTVWKWKLPFYENAKTQ